MTDDPFNLERFVRAQVEGASYENALREIQRGRKASHWIWWVFPQLAGLGRSPTSRAYAIASLDEAIAYLAHPVLGPRLRTAIGAMMASAEVSAAALLGPDDVKFRSSLTLFARAAPGERLFRDALERFFDARADDLTDRLLSTLPTGPARDSK
jgi:uncharacterized protein (DUF1810 family)